LFCGRVCLYSPCWPWTRDPSTSAASTCLCWDYRDAPPYPAPSLLSHKPSQLPLIQKDAKKMGRLKRRRTVSGSQWEPALVKQCLTSWFLSLWRTHGCWPGQPVLGTW
jgi:hypothetical protein